MNLRNVTAIQACVRAACAIAALVLVAAVAWAEDTAEDAWVTVSSAAWNLRVPRSWEAFRWKAGPGGTLVREVVPWRGDRASGEYATDRWRVPGAGDVPDCECSVSFRLRKPNDTSPQDDTELTAWLRTVRAEQAGEGRSPESDRLEFRGSRRERRLHGDRLVRIDSTGDRMREVEVFVPDRDGAWVIGLRGPPDAVAAHAAEFDAAAQSFDAKSGYAVFNRLALALVFVVALALVLRGIRRDARAAKARPDEPLVETLREGVPAATAESVCANCGTVLAAAYCGACGQKRIRGRLDLREVVSDWFAKFLDLERGFAGTVAGLTVRPRRVLREYLSGRRASYCSPVRYFTTWVIVDALAHTSWFGGRRAEGGPVMKFVGYLGGRDALAWGDQLRSLDTWMTALFFPLVVAGLCLRLFRASGLRYAEHLAVALFAGGQSLILSTALGLTARWTNPRLVVVLHAATWIWASAILVAFYSRTHGVWGSAWRLTVALVGVVALIVWFALTMIFASTIARGAMR